MYEYAKRIGTEISGAVGLKRQAQKYLAAINTLQLVDEKYRWHVTPRVVEGGASPKRDADGEEVPRGSYKPVDVVDLLQIKKEYALVQARLKLADYDSNMAQ